MSKSGVYTLCKLVFIIHYWLLKLFNKDKGYGAYYSI